jgi:hypothetical protein
VSETVVAASTVARMSVIGTASEGFAMACSPANRRERRTLSAADAHDTAGSDATLSVVAGPVKTKAT